MLITIEEWKLYGSITMLVHLENLIFGSSHRPIRSLRHSNLAD